MAAHTRLGAELAVHSSRPSGMPYEGSDGAAAAAHSVCRAATSVVELDALSGGRGAASSIPGGWPGGTHRLLRANGKVSRWIFGGRDPGQMVLQVEDVEE